MKRWDAVLDEAGYHSITVGKLAHFHGTVCATRVQPALGIGQQVCHTHANVPEQCTPRVLAGEGIQQHMNWQTPDLYVPIS